VAVRAKQRRNAGLRVAEVLHTVVRPLAFRLAARLLAADTPDRPVA